MPKMIAQARPEKTGSSVITQLPSSVVPAVSRIGRVRTATLRMIASPRSKPSRQRHVDEVDQHDRVADDDPGQGDHADHGRGREEDGIVVAADLLVRRGIQQPEAGHDADQRQRNRQHDEQRQHAGLRLKHEDHEDPQQGGGEGQSQVAKHVQRDLPFALAGPLDLVAGGNRPGVAAAGREPGAVLHGPHAWRDPQPRTRGPVCAIELHVHDRVGRWAAGHFAEHVHHAAQILVVDRPVFPLLDEAAKRAQLDDLAGCALDVQLAQVVDRRALRPGQAQFDPQRIDFVGHVQHGGT